MFMHIYVYRVYATMVHEYNNMYNLITTADKEIFNNNNINDAYTFIELPTYFTFIENISYCLYLTDNAPMHFQL